MSNLRIDADTIIKEALSDAQPGSAVKKALERFNKPDGETVLVAVGKAAWAMAKAAYEALGSAVSRGIVITKYGHSQGEIGNLLIREAGHPVPDDGTFSATAEALEMVSGLKDGDCVLFLLSGGGSALFESPLIPVDELKALISRLLQVGADITQINTIRKRFSAVKGGGFARICSPAHVFSIILSDVLGDRLDVIASGPTARDMSDPNEARQIMDAYNIVPTAAMEKCLLQERPGEPDNVENHVTGSVRQLCQSAEKTCARLGYKTVVLTDRLCCTARDAGSFLGSIAQYNAGSGPIAFIMGGETVVKITGSGLGGRNQEIALAAAPALSGLGNCAVFSLGSDGTDGPTDAAGGFCDGETVGKLAAIGLHVPQILDDNDSYHALKSIGDLIVTGPTGTNVNDLTVVLVR